MFANLATTAFHEASAVPARGPRQLRGSDVNRYRFADEITGLRRATYSTHGLWRHDVVMSESETRAAFLTAAIVLLVMPIVYMIGLASAMLILQFTPWREMSAVMFGFAIVWGIVVLAGVLLAARRLHRPAARV